MRRFTSRAVVLCLCLCVWGCKYGSHLERGDEAMQRGAYEVAISEYEAARELKPDKPEAHERLEGAKRALVGALDQEARAALAGDDILGALLAARKAYERLPDSEVTRRLVMDVSNAAHAKADDLVRARDFASAMRVLELLGKQLPSELDRAAPKLDAVRSAWVVALRDQAVAAEAAGRDGDALLAWAKLATLGADAQARQRSGELRAKIVKAGEYRVLLSGRGVMYDGVVQRLADLGRGTALFLAHTGAKTPAAKARLNVGAPKFARDRKTRTEVVSYQSGTRQVANPFYENRQDDLVREEGRLVDLENDVTDLESDVSRYQQDVAREGPTPNVSTGAEQNLSRAQSSLEYARGRVQDQRRAVQRAREALAREPQFKEEAVYSDHSFTVTTHVVEATMHFSAAVEHADGRKAMGAEETLRAAASDDSHEAQSIANVSADPLSLPDERELTAQLLDAAAARAAGLFSASFQQWRDALLQSAVNAPTDDERVDLYVRYILTDPKNVAPMVNADLKALRGIPDAAGLLSVP